MTEIEAKYLMRRPEQLAELLSFLGERGYALEKRGAATHVDAYLDTPDWAILHAGWACRSRQHGKRSTLSLKSTGRQDGSVFVREEIEQALGDAPLPGSGLLPPGPVADVLRPIVGDAPRHKLFSVRTRRTRYGLRPPGDDGAAIELDVDETLIRAKKADEDAAGRLEFVELEFELEAGDPACVADLATVLGSRDGLRPARLSKFERGLHTAGLTPSIAAEALPPVAAADPVLPLLFAYLGRQHRIMIAYQPVAWEGLDAEGVHKMRVATRRTRALLRAFREILAAELENRIETELRWLAGQLGQARDADICVRDIGRFNKTLSTDAAIAAAAYADHLRDTRDDAYANLARTFESERYASLMATLDDFVAAGPAAQTMQSWGNLSIDDCAARLIGETAQKVTKRGDGLGRDSPARDLHRLRIIGKRLRYVLEFFSLAHPGRWARPIAALQRLHDLLGDHQDGVTSRALLADYAESIPPGAAASELLLAIGRLMQIEDQRMAEARARFPNAWKRFRKSMD